MRRCDILLRRSWKIEELKYPNFSTEFIRIMNHTNSANSDDDNVATKTTPEDIREMEELLPPIMRKHGKGWSDKGIKWRSLSIDVLDGVHFMKMTDEVQINVIRDYVKELTKRYNDLSIALKKESICAFPYNVYDSKTKVWSWSDMELLSWSDVELLLSKFPPQMAKQAIMPIGPFSLYIAAESAPRSTLVQMIELAPEASRTKDNHTSGQLPLHIALISENVTAVELLSKAYPRGLLVKDARGHDPIQSAFKHETFNFSYAVVNALIKGLIIGLSNDNSCTELERIFDIISRLIVEKCDRSKNVMAAFLHRIVRETIERYENRDDCDVCEMLVRVYCMTTKAADALIYYLIVGLSDSDSYTELKRIVEIISKQIFERCNGNRDKIAIFLRSIVNQIFGAYNNRDNFDMREMLLRIYCVVTKSTDVIDMASCLKVVVGNNLGRHCFFMAVEYKLLNIIEMHERL